MLTRLRPFIVAAALGVVIVSPLAAQTVPAHGDIGPELEALWYSVNSESSTQSFLAHANRISIIAPQVFRFDAMGRITGHVDPRVIAEAHRQHVKVVPLVVNPGFDQHLVHVVMTSAVPRKHALANLAALCRQEHLDGIQFDLENVNIADKAALTSFARDAADSVHAAGCTLSAAVVPRTGESQSTDSYQRWMYENWRGAYDYKALAESLDFISYMTYAEHTGNSTPGPVGGFQWMEECLKYVLSLGVPASKISLGIAGYSDWWYPAWDKKAGPRTRGNDISYAKAESLLTKTGAQAVWDDRQKSPVAVWSEDGVFDYLWIEDARAFAAKLELVRKYHLRGYSAWVLGTEDPAIWSLKPE